MLCALNQPLADLREGRMARKEVAAITFYPAPKLKQYLVKLKHHDEVTMSELCSTLIKEALWARKQKR